ncbi:unnamed protein product, partial [marine sediment metagenome]
AAFTSKSGCVPAWQFITNYVRIGGTNYYGVEELCGQVCCTCVYTTTWTTNPATGSPWTIATLNAAEFGIRVRTGLAFVYSTYVYLTVTYTPPYAPVVSTGAATDISANTTHCWATMNGDVTDDGGADVTARGFAWGTTCNETTPGSDETPSASYTDNWTEYNADWGEGAFSYTANLSCCETYCYRAYAQNSEGWGWGEEQTFTMLCDPDIDVKAATYVQATTARLNS